MIKNSLKTLQERYGNIDKENANNLAKFMKRRRLEKKKTLEETSRGICSPSYLSKIENGLADVDDYYFQSLFERLDLEYENIKMEREMDFFSKIVKYYLLERYDLLEEKLKQMVNVNSYCDTELELIILLNNIINKNFDEAEILIEKLEGIRNTLSKDEIYLLSFLVTLYLYSTDQYTLASEQIEILTKHPSENMYYNIAVCDLGIDIYFILGKESLFHRYYQKLKQFNNQELYNNRVLIHNLQLLVFLAKNGKKDLIEELNVLIMSLNDFNIDKEKIVLNEILVYYYLKDYEKVLEMTKSFNNDIKILSVEAMAINKMKDFGKCFDFVHTLKIANSYYPSATYINFIEYMRQNFEQYSYTKSLAYLKSVVIPLSKSDYAFWILEEEKQEFLSLCYELGKYKEAIRFLIKTGDFKNSKRN